MKQTLLHNALTAWGKIWQIKGEASTSRSGCGTKRCSFPTIVRA